MFYDEFLKLCEIKGIAKQKACIDCGVSRTAWNKWKNGALPNGATISRLADYFGVSSSQLLGEETKKVPAQEGEHSQAIKIPVLGDVPAGIPIEAIEEILDWEEIPPSMLRGGKEYFALEVKGDSMWPNYLPGDVVIVQKTPDCETGDDCIVYINGYNATLKTVKKGEDGSISIIPKNQSYTPHTYSAEEVRDLPISIAGVVVELRRKIGRG